MARILAQVWPECDEAKVLILDEPIAFLDLKYQHLILGLLHDLKKKNLGILLVIHDLFLAKLYADEAILLKEGGVFALGHPEEVITPAVIKDAYEVDPALVNF